MNNNEIIDQKENIPRHSCLTSAAGCLFSIPPLVVISIIVVISMAGLILYFGGNTDLFGLWAPDFDKYTVDSAHTQYLDPDGNKWEIKYETKKTSSFKGKVRYISTIRSTHFPLLTHDVLVTTGDYANPDLVATSVLNHKFIWKSLTHNYPKGTINLLHIVPKNKEIYDQLIDLTDDEQVIISGIEILRINAFDPTGLSLGYWTDAGCNSILVTSVTRP